MAFLSFVFWPDYTLQMAASDSEATYIHFWYNTAGSSADRTVSLRLSINYNMPHLKIIIVNDVLEP